MSLEDSARLVNRGMVGFDLALGLGALAAPRVTLELLGHTRPSADAAELFRRCGPVWLTFAAGHAVAEARGEPRDCWALAWMRGSEIATAALFSRSPGFRRPGARLSLWGAGAANVAMAVGFGALARRSAAG